MKKMIFFDSLVICKGLCLKQEAYDEAKRLEDMNIVSSFSKRSWENLEDIEEFDMCFNIFDVQSFSKYGEKDDMLLIKCYNSNAFIIVYNFKKFVKLMSNRERFFYNRFLYLKSKQYEEDFEDEED